jgi:6-phosphofructokinase 2
MEITMTDTSSKPIAVLALNPAVDISYELPQLIADRKVAADRTSYHPGGNGINVARSFTELGVPIRCTSVIGGESGDLLLRLLGDTLGDDHAYFRVAGETRLNATLLQKSPPTQYEVDSRGPQIPPTLLEDMSIRFLSDCGAGIAVLTGSVPPGVPEDHYRKLAERIKAQGGKAVVDAHGPVLQEALKAQPFLVRLNRYVMEMSIKRRLDNIQQVAMAAREVQQRGIEYVCISLASEGAILSGPRNSYHCSAPRVRVHSTVGCGDATVAGLVAAFYRGGGPEDMLRLGVICGSATASHQGTELFTRAEVEQSSHDLDITKLDI